jgi:hypothetical protein
MESPLRFNVIAKLAVAPPHDAISITTLIHPCGSRELQIPIALVDSLLPMRVKAEFTGIIESISGAGRVFFNRYFK